MDIQFKALDHTNFDAGSLDAFVRHQQVEACWRRVGGAWQLVPVSLVEDWSLEQCREIAADVARHMGRDQSAFGAFAQGQVVGFITVSHRLFGQSARYVELVCFQVSEPWRGQGLGRQLFRMACGAARELGAEKLYISGHSARESQAAYRALGCVHAREIEPRLAAEEPFDVQLEYVLTAGEP